MKLLIEILENFRMSFEAMIASPLRSFFSKFRRNGRYFYCDFNGLAIRWT